MAEVFISYKKEDQPRVEPIARALARAGYDVWWDHRIPPGRTYRDVIGAALHQANCVIVVWSKLSASAQWVLDEADEGKRRNVLLPILIDDIEIPYGFRQIEAARLVGWNGEDGHPEWVGALEAIATLVGRRPGGPPKPFIEPTPLSEPSARPAAHSQARPANGSSRAGPLIALAVALVVIAGAFAAWKMGALGDSVTSVASATVEDSGASDAGTSSPTNAGSASSAPATSTTPTAMAPPAASGADSDASSANTRNVASPPPPRQQPVRLVSVNVRDTSAFRVLSDGAWVEIGPRGVPRFRFTPQGADGVGLVLLDESRGMRLRVNEDGSGIDGFDQGRWVRFLNATGVERGPRPQAPPSGQPSQGVTRVWFASGGMLARDNDTWIETDPQTGMFNNYRWREESRDGDTILLSDNGRGAGARIELGEGWVYLYFPDWGEFRRHWRIRAVDREQ